jgi:lysophospholipase L1-like esterase
MHRKHFSLLASLLVLACGDDGGAGAGDTATETTGNAETGSASLPTTGSTDGGSATSSTTATAGTQSSSDGTTAVDDEGSTGGPPAIPEVHWVGRYAEARGDAVRMSWSGSGLVVRFDGTGASVVLDDQSRYFTVVVDGQLQPVLATSPGEQTYVLATGLDPGAHTVELYRRTEGSFGPSVFGAVEIEGELLAPPSVERRIEVVGDSITAGYGNEGTAPCSFSPETENHFMTWGAIAARTVGAELHTIAWSGKGIVNNSGDDVFEPMPEIYDRTIAGEGEPWDFSWQADAVVVNLGTNDFSTDGDPPEDVFVAAYVDFLAHLRSRHPGAYLLIVSPSLYGAEAELVDGYLGTVVDERIAGGDPDVGFANINVDWIGSGCNGHPSVATHQGMAARLVEELEARLGW